ncbi:asaB [Symbiodinium sp. CCMP2592]|nr:asaB [Symbiodinium sp. CCMP2592]
MAKCIPNPYITIDVAEAETGWIVLEAGDGGVSGPAPGQAPGVHTTISYASTDGEYKDDGKRKCFVVNGRYRCHNLEAHGFALMRAPLEKTQGHDLYNYLVASKVLYPLAEDVLRRAFPTSTKVLVFDHIARNDARYAQEAKAGEITKMLASSYAFHVHGDYTVRSGFSRARSLLEPHEDSGRIEAAIQQRFAFVNVWVPLKKVERDPLGMIEWSSQRPQDVVSIKFIYPHRTGEIYRVLPSDHHRWVYYPDMMPGECLIFKVFDSATDGRSRFSLHAAFQDPNCQPDAPSRESIEMRCVVFFGDLPKDFASSFVAPPMPQSSRHGAGRCRAIPKPILCN